MKLPRKLIALALAGVMALTLLTGCGGNSKAQTVAKDAADYYNRIATQHGRTAEPIQFTYSVPELSQIKSQLALDWFTNDYVFLSDGTSAQSCVRNALASYSSAEKYSVKFTAFKLPKGASTSLTSYYLCTFHDGPQDVFASSDFYNTLKTAARGKIGVAYKTIGEDTYCIAVVILEK